MNKSLHANSGTAPSNATGEQERIPNKIDLAFFITDDFDFKLKFS